MKREVAEEWMNRYLDGDLSEEDADILFRHIDNNPDDADTFRIMSALSLQLEKLPDVKPKFSLVDSILPTLDDIDAERRAEIASDIGIMEPQHEKQDEFTERRRQRSSWRDRLPVRTIGGLVAAGVILGVSIATYEPKTLSDAGPAPSTISMEQQANDQETGAAKSNAEQDATLQAPATTTPESTTSPEANTQPQSEQSPKVAPDSGSGTLNQQPTTPDQSTPETGTGTSQESTPSSGNKGGNPPAGSQPETESSPPSSGTGTSSTSNNDDQSMKQQQIAPDTDSSGTSESSSATGTSEGTADNSSSTNSKSTTDSTTPNTTNNDESSSTVAPKASTDDSSSKDSSASKDNASSTTPETSNNDVAPKTYSLAPEADPKVKDDSKVRSFSTNTIQQEQEWISPTSQFAVVLTTSNTLRLDSLSKNNINGRTVVATATIDGTWLNGQWTKDGKAFNYQVAKEGKTKWYKLSTAGLQ